MPKSKIAGGNINICTFVQTDPAAPMNGCIQCTGGNVPILGIAQEFTNQMAGTQGVTPALAASKGQPIAIRDNAPGDIGMQDVLLCVGSGYTVEPDNYLVSDASGNGIPLSITSSRTTAQYVGAIAVEAGTPGSYIRVTSLDPGTMY